MLFSIMMWMVGLAVAGGGVVMIVYAYSHRRTRYATVHYYARERQTQRSHATRPDEIGAGENRPGGITEKEQV